MVIVFFINLKKKNKAINITEINIETLFNIGYSILTDKINILLLLVLLFFSIMAPLLVEKIK